MLEEMIGQYRQIDEPAVMEAFLRKNPELEEGLRYGSVSDEEWAADYDKVVGLYEEDLISTDSSGSKMRSRGELIIASRLEFFGIPYRYEARVTVNGINRVPDFTIRRPRDGKIIYWEHLGMTTDAAYLER